MKKLFTLAVIVLLAFSACEEPKENTVKLPKLTIRNESSFVLTDVMFSGIPFKAEGTNDLPPSTSSVQPLTSNDLNKAGYITFVRKDIGISCRTEAVSVGEKDLIFTFIDSTGVEEQGNSSNKKALSLINFLSQVTVERAGLRVAKNDNVDLGESLLNTMKQNDFTLKNTGVGKLLFDGTQPIRITNDADNVFTVVQPSSSEVAPNGSLSFRINFTPKDIKVYNAAVTIRSNDQNGDFSFLITAGGVPPKPAAEIHFSGSGISQNGTINAGDVLITQSKNITVTVKNTGTALLTIDTANISISGTDASVFTKLGDPGINISVGNSSTFDIKCEPLKEGENNATLRIPTNDDARSTIEVYLRVTGVKGASVLQLSQGTTVIQNNSFTPFDFGNVRVNETKTLAFNVTNKGNIPLILNGEPAVGSSNSVFTVTNQPPAGNRTLQPNATVQFILQYQPSIEAKQTSEITIMNNSDDGVFAFTVEGTGTVPRPLAKILYTGTEIHQDGIIDAGEVLLTQSKIISVIIRNDGNASMTVDNMNIDITGTDAQGFMKITIPASTILAGAQASFSIQCTPNRQGEHNATLTIPTNDISRNPVLVNLKMTGVQGAPILELSQDSTIITNNSITPFDMGRVLLDSSTSKTFTIKNTGNIALELTGTPFIESSSALFEIPAQPGVTVLNPSSTTTFAVRYTPTDEQTDTAYITILNNSGNMVFTLNLKATGYTPKPQITISQDDKTVSQYSEFDFGTFFINEPENLTFTITNSGEAPLTFVTVNNNRVNILDNTANAFSVVQQPSAAMIVAPGNTATFILRFNPTTEGLDYRANVQLETNSENNSVFSFWLKGQCERRVYKIGDTGPAGGIIFYDAGSVINGWRYLEAYTTDLTAQWGGSNYTVGTGLSIGDGKANTQKIVALLNQLGETLCAAQVCTSLNINGFKDWFLPSRDELNVMYNNRLILKMSASMYWSSSESSGNFASTAAWARNFSASSVSYTYVYSSTYAVMSIQGGASVSDSYKLRNNLNVRPIRSF